MVDYRMNRSQYTDSGTRNDVRLVIDWVRTEHLKSYDWLVR